MGVIIYCRLPLGERLPTLAAVLSHVRRHHPGLASIRAGVTTFEQPSFADDREAGEKVSILTSTFSILPVDAEEGAAWRYRPPLGLQVQLPLVSTRGVDVYAISVTNLRLPPFNMNNPKAVEPDFAGQVVVVAKVPAFSMPEDFRMTVALLGAVAQLVKGDVFVDSVDGKVYRLGDRCRVEEDTRAYCSETAAELCRAMPVDYLANRIYGPIAGKSMLIRRKLFRQHGVPDGPASGTKRDQDKRLAVLAALHLEMYGQEGRDARVAIGRDEREAAVMLASICSQCSGHGARAVCARCKTARYCNALCQRSHWPRHKLVCRAKARSATVAGPDAGVNYQSVGELRAQPATTTASASTSIAADKVLLNMPALMERHLRTTVTFFDHWFPSREALGGLQPMMAIITPPNNVIPVLLANLSDSASSARETKRRVWAMLDERSAPFAQCYQLVPRSSSDASSYLFAQTACRGLCLTACVKLNKQGGLDDAARWRPSDRRLLFDLRDYPGFGTSSSDADAAPAPPTK